MEEKVIVKIVFIFLIIRSLLHCFIWNSLRLSALKQLS